MYVPSASNQGEGEGEGKGEGQGKERAQCLAVVRWWDGAQRLSRAGVGWEMVQVVPRRRLLQLDERHPGGVERGDGPLRDTQASFNVSAAFFFFLPLLLPV